MKDDPLSLESKYLGLTLVLEVLDPAVTSSFSWRTIDDFECICRKDFVWDQSTQSCKPINPCFPQSYIPCSKSGTLTCVALNMQTPLCICNPEYSGKDCGQLRNACLTRFNKTESNGNTNCGVIQGNLCNPILGTDSYRCSCGMGWVPSPTLSYDNCDVLNDPCGTFSIEEVEDTNVTAVNKKEGPRIRTTIDCQNGGFCSSSPDNSKAACLCLSTASGDQGFTGSYCEIPRGAWSGWTEYSPCRDKTCGISRYKWRRRQCLNETVEIEQPDGSPRENSIDCFGISEELRPCEEALPCNTFRLSGYYRREILHFSTLYAFLTFLLVELALTFLLYKTCGFWLVRFILREMEDSKVKKETEHNSGTQQTTNFICEEISKSKALDILSRTPTPELFIDDKVEAKSGSPTPLDNEQYLELIRQRIIQRILELIEEKELEKARLQQVLMWSKATRLWNFLKFRLLRWADLSLRWVDIAIRTARAVIRTGTSRPPNEKTVTVTKDNKGELVETMTRQVEKVSIERKDHQKDAKRKLLLIKKKETPQTDTIPVDEKQEKTLSMANLLGSFSRKSPSKSREDTAVEKDTLFTSDNMNNPEPMVKDKMIEQKKLEALKNQKRMLKKQPKRKSRRKIYISDTLDQISSSEFNTDIDDGDDNAKTIIRDLVPGAQFKESKPEENIIFSRPLIPEPGQSFVIRQNYKMEEKASEGMRKQIEDRKETHPSERFPTRIVLNKPSVAFGINEAQRLSSTIAKHKLPKVPEDKSATEDMHAPVPVTSINRRIRNTTSAGSVERVENPSYSSYQFRRNMEGQESDASVNLPPHPIRTTSYLNMPYPPAIVEVSLEDEDEIEHSRRHSQEKPDEKRKSN
ncbi:unnamed protein product [Hymenolepis diminuta]|uniref:EGF-like domain-containing protein n=1 Tax=Hymenolepis diminuta TaxID=6216 RepID=A0A3P6XYF2_HYMDI|nr:unnamed protein product [Hymenolepis diminuta]